MEIFEDMLTQAEKESGNGEKLILDSYIPADGDYILVESDGIVKSCSIHLDKKTRTCEMNPFDMDLLEKCRFYDYHSRLVSIDKPQDPKKVIHSNSYLSFWVKHDSLENGKLDKEAIDRYFDILKEPLEKYKKFQDREMYQYIAEKIGDVNQEKLEYCRNWIKNHIFHLEDLGISLSGKNYLKVFFEVDPVLYIQEEQRYLITKIYNKNDYNIKIDGEIYGLPNDNLGLNSKKPFLENKSRKMTIPYLITTDEAVRQRQFFDYLMNKANAGESDLYFDNEQKIIISKKKGEMIDSNFTGFFLQIKKGKEVEIHHQDTIVDYRYFLQKPFLYENVLGLEDPDEVYKEYSNKSGIQEIINDVLFSKYLVGNYFTEEADLTVDGELKRNLIGAREAIFSWLYKGREINMDQILHRICLNMMKNSIQNGYTKKLGKQFNLMCSLDDYFKGERKMARKYVEVRDNLREKIRKEDSAIESDTEYFYAVGQLVYYFISLSQAKEKVHALANPFFNTVDNQVIKQRLHKYFMKYNYQIKFNSYQFNRMYAMVREYEPDGKVLQDDLFAGYIGNNLIYEKIKKQINNENEGGN